MSHLIMQADGVYMDDGSGRLSKIEDAVAVFDKQAPGDLVIRIAAKHVRVDAVVDPLQAYNYLDADVRRLAVAAGVITQGEANRLGRVDDGTRRTTE